MTHQNYFAFSAQSHYDLGLQMGKQFYIEARTAIEKNQDEGFEKRKQTAEKMLVITEKHFPYYIDEIKGYSAGAGVDFLEMWTIAIEDDAYIETSEPQVKCTSIITNKGRLLAHSEDQTDIGLEDTICIVKRKILNLTMLEIYYYNTFGGVSVGVNSYGYASAGNTLLYGSKQIGIPKGIIGRMLLETKNPDADFEKIKAMQLADGYNHNLMNTKGQIVNIELSTKDVKISHTPSPFAHSNHCLLLKDREPAKDDYGTISRLTTAMNKTQPYMAVDGIKKILEDNMLGPDRSIFNERTVGRMVIDFENLTSYIWLLREDEKGWIEYPLDFIDNQT